VTEYLDLEDLLAAATAALAEAPTVGDLGILEAAAARPRATAFGEDIYPDLHTKAAALLHSLITGHPLVDGNERLGWVAMRLFYRFNGRDIQVPPNDAFDLVSQIADGSIRDVAAIAAVLRRWASPLSGERGIEER
jgi:death-on-curing protein